MMLQFQQRRTLASVRFDRYAARVMFLVLAISLWPTGTEFTSAEEPGLQLPDGFQASLYADDDLAHDIHSMTLDSLGRVVVSGPGYVRILIDADNNGRAESYTQFVDKPATGSQGMFWLGRHLLCAGDDGLQVFRDDNRDDKADGPPEVFLRIAAGGEHHVHSIQKGPDGWWYVIAGNFSGVTGTYATLPTSPLKSPVNGVLLRLKPDLFGGEIVCDGMRNAYDFAFTPTGDIFTYDSDDERDISLPWYLPTRVIHLLPMSNSGWVSAGWKRPDRFADMPPVIGAFGRGSPTGVICYQHDQFPALYHNGLFVLDWTLGRILALPAAQDSSGERPEPLEFAKGTNQFGFAPTDIEVAPDGSLFVSVGGRGTRGGVYRITCTSRPDAASQTTKPPSAGELDQVLSARQPLSSWSRTSWMPLSKKLGADEFRNAAIDEARRVPERIRAIEILVEMFDGLDLPTTHQLMVAANPAVRARTAWAVGRSNPQAPDIGVLQKLIADPDPVVQRFALEALTTVSGDSATTSALFAQLLPQFAAALDSASREVRLTAAHLISRLTDSQFASVEQQLQARRRGLLWLYLGRQLRSDTISLKAAELAVSLITDKESPAELRLEAVRALELALGDVGPAAGRPPMFDSYAPRLTLASVDLELNPLRSALADVFPTSDSELNHELIRVFAMTSPLNRELLTRILAGMTEQSLPSEDIHRLAALAQFDLERSYEESAATARALIGIDVKIKRLGLRQDTNWDDRIGELFAALVKVDPAMPHLIAEQPGLGLPGHTLFMNQLSAESAQSAIEKFTATIAADENYAWTNEVVFLLSESKKPEHRALLREQLDNLSVRSAVLMTIAEQPTKEDRPLFLEGLQSVQLNAVEACVTALTKLPRNNEPAEQFELLSAARRLINDKREFAIRETVVRLLQNNTGASVEFVFGEEGFKPQPDAMRRWQEALQTRYPDYRPIQADDYAKQVFQTLESVRWEDGDLTRGQRLFERLACAKCHGGRRALGPDLVGAAKRFSRDDLFAAIVDPNRDISPRYQTTSIETKTGRVYSGLIVYESVDGLLLRDAEHQTYRIEADDIESRHAQRVSLMPAGLLKDTDAQGLADLYTYLQSL